jgi:cytochrome b subunit of formate dehydrogenase
MIPAIFIRKNKTLIAIALFMILMAGIHLLKPAFVYMPDGSFRQFGIGYKNKTVIPIWVVSIIIAIMCYLAVSYYLMIL